MKTNRMLRVAFIIACGVLFSAPGFAQATKKPAPKTATAKAADAGLGAVVTECLINLEVGGVTTTRAGILAKVA